MTFTVIIPARYASSRLPGKPLAKIGDKTMIEHVYNRAKLSHAERVIVATDDQKIFDEVNQFGGDVCLTSVDHASGTDRLQEVVSTYEFDEHEIVVNVQGDEPLIPPEVINQVAKNLHQCQIASAATLCEPIKDVAAAFDENIVKVTMDREGNAMYFSRATIPWEREKFSSLPTKISHENLLFRHIGIYAYRVNLLNHFVTWPLCPLEALEKLEQLRILYNGHKIHTDIACMDVPGGVDTVEDLQQVNEWMNQHG